MTHFLHLTAQSVTFLTIFAAGFVYTAIALIFADLGGEHDAGHDVHADHGDGSHSAVSFFSPKIIAIFLVGFGAGGYVATQYACSTVLSTFIGLCSGFTTGLIAVAGMRLLYSQQASSEIQLTDLVGARGVVSVRILPGAAGEVNVSAKGFTHGYPARHKYQYSMQANTVVKVVAVEAGVLIVE